MKNRDKFKSYIRDDSLGVPVPGLSMVKQLLILTAVILAISLFLTSCSKPLVSETDPEERIRIARKDMKKRRYQKAYESLDEMRTATAGTRLGGEVQFLLAEASFKSGKYPEAETQYAAYLNAYPEGPFAEQALFMQAQAKVKQLLKRSFLTFKTYIPYDRDISLLRESRVLFQIYMDKYPSGEWIDIAASRVEELMIKEGRHVLEIASFYLRKNNPRSALARARLVLDGDYPEVVKSDARDLIREAERSLPNNDSSQDL